MKYLLLILFISSQVIADEGYDVKKRTCLEGVGEKWEIFDPSENTTKTIYGLKLMRKIQASDSTLGMEEVGDSLQYVTRSKVAFKLLKKNTGKKLKVCGKLALQITSHHYTHILIDADTVFVSMPLQKRIWPLEN